MEKINCWEISDSAIGKKKTDSKTETGQRVIQEHYKLFCLYMVG